MKEESTSHNPLSLRICCSLRPLQNHHSLKKRVDKPSLPVIGFKPLVMKFLLKAAARNHKELLTDTVTTCDDDRLICPYSAIALVTLLQRRAFRQTACAILPGRIPIKGSTTRCACRIRLHRARTELVPTGQQLRAHQASPEEPIERRISEPTTLPDSKCSGHSGRWRNAIVSMLAGSDGHTALATDRGGAS